jgi:hypothetical protein
MLTLLKCHRHKLSSFYRLLDRYQKPITALAIFTDDKMDYRPQRYDYQCIGTTVTYTFNTYKVIEQDESTLSMHPNPFALVVLTVLKAIQNKNSSDLSLLSLKIDLFKRMYNRKIEKPTMRAMANFLKMYVHFSEPESNRIFKNEIQSITNNNTTMGIEEVILHREKQRALNKA